MSTISTSSVDARWRVTGGAVITRVLIAVADPAADPEELLAALTPAKSSVLLLDDDSQHCVATAASAVERLLRDGCAAAELTILGIGRMATIAPAACLLLRMRGSELPGAVALAHGDDAVVLAPACTPTERFVELMASWAAGFQPGAHDGAGVLSAAAHIDHLLSAGWS